MVASVYLAKIISKKIFLAVSTDSFHISVVDVYSGITGKFSGFVGSHRRGER